MSQLNEKLLSEIKEAIIGYEIQKYPSLFASFKEKRKLSKKTKNIELESLLTQWRKWGQIFIFDSWLNHSSRIKI